MIQIAAPDVNDRVSIEMAFKTRTAATTGRQDNSPSQQYLLWIDSVGCWMLCLSDEVTIGGPTSRTADIKLMANLSRKHIRVQRLGEGYAIDPLAETRINDRSIYDPTSLGNDYNLKLGASVELQFRIPTALSSTAVLDFVSGHRPAHSVDGIVLMNDNCLLGPGSENHIQCPDWPATVVLFMRDGQLCCKSQTPLFCQEKAVKDYAKLAPGTVISSEELRFRVEEIQLE